MSSLVRIGLPLKNFNVQGLEDSVFNSDDEFDDNQVSRAVPEPEESTFEWPEGISTVMVKNIPNRYTAEELIAEMFVHQFYGTTDYDFLYLPIDFSTKRNRGYAFINFTRASIAARFFKLFNKSRLMKYMSHKIIGVTPAVTQGFDANVKQLLRKEVQRVQNQWFRPLIFKELGD